METWKDIEGYEGLYQISDLGRIKSLFKVVKGKDGKSKSLSEKIMSTQINNSDYTLVHLSKNNKRSAFTVHRLVAIHHIQNPYNLPEVNHTNGNKRDNRASELEWATKSENMKHSFRIGLSENAREKARERMRLIGIKYAKKNTLYLLESNKKLSRPVLQLSLTGELINEFPSVKAARKATRAHNINQVLNGKQPQCNGFKFSYK